MTHEKTIADLQRRNDALQDAIDLLRNERDALAESLVRTRTVSLETEIQTLNDIISDQYARGETIKRRAEKAEELLGRLAGQIIDDFWTLDGTFTVSGPTKADNPLLTFKELEKAGFFPSLALAMSAISETKPSRALPPDIKNSIKPMERKKPS